MSKPAPWIQRTLLALIALSLPACERPPDGWRPGSRGKAAGAPTVVTIATPGGDAGRRVDNLPIEE